MTFYFKAPDDYDRVFAGGLPEGIHPTGDEMLEVEHKLSYNIREDTDER